MNENVKNEVKDKLQRHLDSSYILISVGDLRELIPELHQLLNPKPSPPTPTPLYRPDEIIPIPELEKRLIREALRRTSGNIREASAVLGISKRTLYRKFKEYSHEFREIIR